MTSFDHRPTLCLVTSRRRACPDCDEARAARCVLEQARAAVAAGVEIVQIREREMEAGPLVGLVAAIVRLARGSATRVVVNDRLDVALAGRADGVHLRADSAPASAVRQIVPPGFIIGRSVHRPGEAASAARGADYVIAGTVYETMSKPGAGGLLGIPGLSAIVREVDMPVLAIGGITIDRAGEVASTGAAGIAAIGLFLSDGPEDGCRSRALGPVVECARARFQALNTHQHAADITS
jgi:thiamine-phosphate diphosphorylase